MGLYTGVEARPKSIRIRFKWLGKWLTEPIAVAPTRRNQKAASELLASVNDKIRKGTFNYFNEFPDSKNIDKLGLWVEETKLFGEVAHDYIASNSHLSKGTIATYIKALNLYWLPIWGGTPIDEIKYSDIAKVVSAIPWQNPKTRNNNLTPLRGVFQLAWHDMLIEQNPCKRIDNQKQQKKRPDPFSKAETAKILEGLKEYHPSILNYFEFAFFTGLRIEELIAIEWGDVDFKNSRITIQRARTAGHTKPTKGYTVRDVVLVPQAKAALERQRAIANVYPTLSDVIFLNPVTNKQWNDNGKQQRVSYWNPTLARLGIRHRPPKFTRHTYATFMLMAGVDTAIAAEQMGHSPIVFQTVYAKWISSSADDVEMGKLTRFLGE